MVDGAPSAEHGREVIPNVLTIAGSDPSGGAGIQADLKVFSALETFGTSVITALTAQNTRGVTGVVALEAIFVMEQLDTLRIDVALAAAKTGMLANERIVRALADRLGRDPFPALVVDPVMVSKSGHRLLEPGAEEAFRRALLPRATLVTPNLPETAVLLEGPEPRTLLDMAVAAREIHRRFGAAALVKGGHREGPGDATDLLFDGRSIHELALPRIATQNTHGTGCTLSAAITALLARGRPLLAAVQEAKAYLSAALVAADALTVGHGHGPVHHFHAWWNGGAPGARGHGASTPK